MILDIDGAKSSVRELPSGGNDGIREREISPAPGRAGYIARPLCISLCESMNEIKKQQA